MPVNRPTLGSCPHCDSSIPDHRLLIEYDTASGRSRYADCPNCRQVVHPA